MANLPESTRRAVAAFADMPDAALVDIKTMAALMGCGVSTLWRRAAKEAGFPKPVKLGVRLTRWKVADVRALLAGSAR
jgi:predicted DNA-binding transcriptional regulator AlpA